MLVVMYRHPTPQSSTGLRRIQRTTGCPDDIRVPPHQHKEVMAEIKNFKALDKYSLWLYLMVKSRMLNCWYYCHTNLISQCLWNLIFVICQREFVCRCACTCVYQYLHVWDTNCCSRMPLLLLSSLLLLFGWSHMHTVHERNDWRVFNT